MLRDHASQQSYVFTGPVMIELEPADDLTTGRFRVRSQAISSVSTPTGDPSDTQVRRAAAMIEVNGKRHPLLPPGIVIGRGNDADLRINDPGVSRRHAEIRVDDNGGDPARERARPRLHQRDQRQRPQDRGGASSPTARRSGSATPP